MSRSFKDYFADYISELFEEFPDEKQGILIIIDDINGLSDSREFADWYKKLADTLAVSKHYHLPVYFLLAVYPEKFNALVIHEESFGSIFHTDCIDRLDDSEVADFFKDTFKQCEMEISIKIKQLFRVKFLSNFCHIRNILLKSSFCLIHMTFIN